MITKEDVAEAFGIDLSNLDDVELSSATSNTCHLTKGDAVVSINVDKKEARAIGGDSDNLVNIFLKLDAEYNIHEYGCTLINKIMHGLLFDRMMDKDCKATVSVGTYISVIHINVDKNTCYCKTVPYSKFLRQGDKFYVDVEDTTYIFRIDKEED